MIRPPSLFPAPRDVRRHAPERRVTAPVTEHLDRSLPAQGYVLAIRDGQASLVAADDLGLRYGRDTLAQLRHTDGSLPEVEIADHPDLLHRAYMLDVSRSRVPTRETLGHLVDTLAACRFTQLQLYVEHTVAYAGHEAVWGNASPLTPADLEWLDGQCRAHGIELAGNQNCFGHMERWLSVEGYRDRAECPEGWEMAPGLRRRPTVLAPTPENAAFACDLVREQMDSLTSRTVNIGCDETFELGRGVSADEVAARGIGAVYIDHLQRIMGPLLDDGLHVQFWGDVARDHADLLGDLPDQGWTALAWTYEAPRVDGDPRAAVDDVIAQMGFDLGSHLGFETNAGPFAERDRPFWVAPGTSSWNSLIGRLDNATGNIDDAVDAAARLRSDGLLLTDWGDNGHLQPLPVSLPPIVHAGAMAWCAATNRGRDLAVQVDRIVDDSAGVIGRVLTTIGDLWHQTGRTAINGSPLQAGLCPHQFVAVAGETDVDATRAVIDTLDAQSQALHAAAPSRFGGSGVADQIDTAIALARVGARRLLAAADHGSVRVADLDAEITDVAVRHRASWLATSRPGGLTYSESQITRSLPTT